MLYLKHSDISNTPGLRKCDNRNLLWYNKLNIEGYLLIVLDFIVSLADSLPINAVHMLLSQLYFNFNFMIVVNIFYPYLEGSL